MRRSKTQPTAAVATIATTMASPTAERLSASESAWVQSPSGRSTSVAAKAPTETKAPWPKFSTSIRPKTSVRPLAMMKIIMPMASPATVSVTQAGKLPTSGSMAIATAGTRTSGA